MVKSVGSALEPLAASFSEHNTVCKTRQIRDCGQCWWQAKGPRIMNQLAHWIKYFDEHNTFMDKQMAGLTGNFGIGCVTCHKFATTRRTAFAKFSVCDPTMIKANKFLCHLRSALHLEAQARSLNGHPIYSESNKRNLVYQPHANLFGRCNHASAVPASEIGRNKICSEMGSMKNAFETAARTFASNCCLQVQCPWQYKITDSYRKLCGLHLALMTKTLHFSAGWNLLSHRRPHNATDSMVACSKTAGMMQTVPPPKSWI